MPARRSRAGARIAGLALTITTLSLFALSGSVTGSAGRAVADDTDPGPFPDVYAPGDTYTVPGERDGSSEFGTARYPQLQPKQPGEMDFEHYHSEAEITWWLKTWARDHPEFVELRPVGQSFGERPIWQLTITNKATGAATDKPAAYFDGGRHSGEITATEAVLYHAWKLITGYGKDAKITAMVDEKAIYLRPSANPDGGELYKQTAQTNRSSIRPTDNDGDGLLDEDAPTDLNGDGYVSQLRQRVGAGQGDHVIDERDPSGRTMREVGAGQGDYLLFPESHTGGTDGIGGLDLHRNYPYNWRPMPGEDATGRGWTQNGAGEYPLSEPEIRSTHGFLIRNPNIAVVNSMDTPADMVLRGPSTCDDEECVYPKDQRLLEHFDKVGQRLTGYTRAGNVYSDYATQPPRQREGATPEEQQPEPLYGHGPDFGYFQYGAVWYGDELWISGGLVEDYNGDDQYGDWEGQRWCTERGIDDCFLDWETYQHPELGSVQIGGKNPKFFSQNPPAEALEEFLIGQFKANFYLTESLPKINIERATLRETRGTDGATHELRMTVRNEGRIPTALEQAKEVKIVRPDTVNVELPDGAELIGSEPEFYLGGRSAETVRLRLKLPDDTTGELTVRAESTRGGVQQTAVKLPG